jgi:hypothetical protein
VLQAPHPLLVPAGDQRRPFANAPGTRVGFRQRAPTSATTRVHPGPWPEPRLIRECALRAGFRAPSPARPDAADLAISTGYIEKPSLLIGAPKRARLATDAQITLRGDLQPSADARTLQQGDRRVATIEHRLQGGARLRVIRQRTLQGIALAAGTPRCRRPQRNACSPSPRRTTQRTCPSPETSLNTAARVCHIARSMRVEFARIRQGDGGDGVRARHKGCCRLMPSQLLLNGVPGQRLPPRQNVIVHRGSAPALRRRP